MTNLTMKSQSMTMKNPKTITMMSLPTMIIKMMVMIPVTLPMITRTFQLIMMIIILTTVGELTIQWILMILIVIMTVITPTIPKRT